MPATRQESGSKTAFAVVVADRDGFIREWNDMAERIFGYSATEADFLMPEAENMSPLSSDSACQCPL